MKKEIRRENKKASIKIVNNNLAPRNIRRNKTRNLIKADGLTKVNKRMKYYWQDVQAGAYKI